MAKKNEKNILDESLRRLGGILASPSLALSYGHTTPLLEKSWLRRQGLTAEEADAFLDEMCLRGLLDEGARWVVEDLCARCRIHPREAVKRLLAGDGWPEPVDPEE